MASSNAGGAGIYSFCAKNTDKSKGMMRSQEDIERIIHDCSKNSKFYQELVKRDNEAKGRVAEVQSKVAHMTAQQQAAAARVAADAVASVEACRDFGRLRVVLDMDMFYAAVAVLDNPLLGDKPVAVGSMSMMSTTNYHARRWGARSGMPGFIGRALCPDLVFVPADFSR